MKPAGPTPETSLGLARRAAHILGLMIQGLGDGDNPLSNTGKVIASLSANLARFVEFSILGTIGNLLFRHWLHLIYLAEAILIVIGPLYKEAETAGWVALITTLIIHGLSTWIGSRFKRSRRARVFSIITIAVILIAGLVAFTVYRCHCPLPKRWWMSPLASVRERAECLCEAAH